MSLRGVSVGGSCAASSESSVLRLYNDASAHRTAPPMQDVSDDVPQNSTTMLERPKSQSLALPSSSMRMLDCSGSMSEDQAAWKREGD
jgi:hypothetical protein